MSLDWANERYVRVYTRDTTTWKLCDWRARTVLLHLFRKVDRSGVLDVGDDGVAGLAAVLELPLEEIVEPGIAQLVKRGTVEQTADAFVLPNFIEAQEMPASDAQRQRVQREKRRADKRNRDGSITNCDAGITSGHAESRGVTPNRTDPILAEPNHPDFLVGSPRAHDLTVPVPTTAPALSPGAPSQLGLLLEHAIRRLDAARRELDPEARPIGSALTLAPNDRDRLLGKLRATDERERAATLDHCLDVLIAAATAKGDVGMLRVGMLAGESSWDQWRLGTVASVRGQHTARASPAPRAHQPLRGAAAARAETARLEALEAEEKS